MMTRYKLNLSLLPIHTCASPSFIFKFDHTFANLDTTVENPKGRTVTYPKPSRLSNL